MANIINRQQTFSTNGTVTAAGLHNLIDTALVNSAIIKNQQEITTIGTADLLLIAPDSVDASLAPRKVTVQNLLDDGLTAGTFASLNLTGALTYGTATGNRTVSTSATITTGTIPNLTAGTTTSTAATITTGTITTAVIPTLTAGTTTGTAGIFTSGTVATLKSTTGTIGNLSTTIAGDFTISQGTGTLGTTGATLGTYGGATSVPVLAINAKGQVTSTGTAAITSGLTGFRNRIINGDMRIDQRNAGASQTLTNGDFPYTVDRWLASAVGSNATGQRVAGSGSTQFNYQITGAASNTSIALIQRIEANNFYDLAGQTVTLSCNLANSLLTSVGYTISYPTVTDNYSATTSITSGTWTVNSTLTRYTIQISIPAAATTGLQISLNVSGQTSGTWTIGNVQLEAGSTATDFERRPIGTELALCQRYYWRIDGYNAISAIGSGSVYNSTTTCRIYSKYPVSMRSYPTLSMAGSLVSSGGNADNSVSSISASNAGLESSLIDFTTAAGTLGHGKVVYVSSSTSYGVNYVQAAIEL